MNASSTVLTALLRGFYGAVVSGLLTGLGILQQSDNNRTAVIAGSIAALTYLAARGGFEGLTDANRQANGDIKPGDIQPIGEGKAI